jgi:cytochrome c5
MKNLSKKITKSASVLSLSILFLASIASFSQTTDSTTAAVKTNQKPAKARPVHAAQPRDGQQVFAQNCERCHNAPQSFSPNISGTVAQHMRVRANLSEQDVQALMRFLNP